MAVKEYLGHAEIRMTIRYAHLSPAAKQGQVDVLDATDSDVIGAVTLAQGPLRPEVEQHESAYNAGKRWWRRRESNSASRINPKGALRGGLRLVARVSESSDPPSMVCDGWG